MKYDVIIIGAGPSGIFCAYELIRNNPEMRILMIEKGRAIESRNCPKRTTKNVSAANPARLRRVLPEPEHFPTANYPFLRTSVEICRRFLDMTGLLNY